MISSFFFRRQSTIFVGKINMDQQFCEKNIFLERDNFTFVARIFAVNFFTFFLFLFTQTNARLFIVKIILTTYLKKHVRMKNIIKFIFTNHHIPGIVCKPSMIYHNAIGLKILNNHLNLCPHHKYQL